MQQQAQRWIAAGCFEDLVHDLWALVRGAEGWNSDSIAVILDGKTLGGTPQRWHRAGYHGYKRRRPPRSTLR